MKRSLKPLISILMLVALTATLSCRIAGPHCDVFTAPIGLESTKMKVKIRIMVKSPFFSILLLLLFFFFFVFPFSSSTV
ncbi:hypothetical protein Gohar_011002 [Gossypium harknessii]|uniref:Uncharacterized protein n=1 Tax=Gossypium harknessii TaxID=34285 RepID=A0A7J9GSM1_9ROSI|nr:hypothetical protein [Gossypium harknessii]